MASSSLHAGAARAARPLFAVHGADGLPQVFDVDEAGRLHLRRGGPGPAWRSTELTAALPSQAVCGADVRQAPGGGISVALALRDAAGRCTVRVATGVPAALDDADWLALLADTAAMPALPMVAPVTRLAFGPLQAGAPQLLLISTADGTAGATWYCNAAAPQSSLRRLQLPGPAQGASAHAVGTYRLPGVWALHPGGREDELRFTSFADDFGWHVDIVYPNLPARTASVLLAPGSIPNVPDLFAAGERIVVYRGGNTIPQLVAPVAGARLLWTCANGGGEYLAYADGQGALWLAARPRRGAWHAPVRLTQRRAVLTASGGIVHAIARTEEGSLAVRRFMLDGNAAGPGIVALEEIVVGWPGDAQA